MDWRPLPVTRYLLIDGNNLLMRAIYAARYSGMSAGGINTGPLQVFINTLSKHIREEKPTHVGIAWDGGRSDFRTKIDPHYKENRKPGPIQELKEASFPLAKQFCSASNLYHVQLPGIEADDLIADWWREISPETIRSVVHRTTSIVILSSDKDFLQLMGSNPNYAITTQIRLSSADTPTDLWNEDRVRDELGCMPADLPKVMAFTGDLSDDVKGIHGIGPKKAVKLLTSHDWNFTDAVGSLSHEEDRERVTRNLRLVNLREADWQVPGWKRELWAYEPPRFAPTKPGDVLWEPLLRLCAEYELRTVKDRLTAGTLWADGHVQPGRPLRSSAS